MALWTITKWNATGNTIKMGLAKYMVRWMSSSTSVPVSIKTYYTARNINFTQLSESKIFRRMPTAVSRDSLIFNVSQIVREEDHTTSQQEISDDDDFLEDYLRQLAKERQSYMVAFRYGAVVFFNIEHEALRRQCLREVWKHSSTPFSSPHTEEYSVMIEPSLESWSVLGQDQIKVKALDINNVSVISSVLAQSVALDHYHSQADNMLEVFTQLNQEMEDTGNFTMPRKKLFQLVAENNITMTDAISKLGLLERSDTAWKYAQYFKIWDDLRQEFELEDRFENLKLKLELMQNNVKYFLEILQNRKSDTLEWIIILLIAGEILLSLYDIYDRTKEKYEKEKEAGS